MLVVAMLEVVVLLLQLTMNHNHVSMQQDPATAYIANMSHAITTNGVAIIAQNITTKSAADMFHSIIKNNAVNMFHSTIALHAVVSAHSTTTHVIAHIAQNIHVKNAADGYQNTITNVSKIAVHNSNNAAHNNVQVVVDTKSSLNAICVSYCQTGRGDLPV